MRKKYQIWFYFVLAIILVASQSLAITQVKEHAQHICCEKMDKSTQQHDCTSSPMQPKHQKSADCTGNCQLMSCNVLTKYNLNSPFSFINFPVQNILVNTWPLFSNNHTFDGFLSIWVKPKIA